jgi:hypothetical protein
MMRLSESTLKIRSLQYFVCRTQRLIYGLFFALQRHTSVSVRSVEVQNDSEGLEKLLGVLWLCITAWATHCNIRNRNGRRQ